jgi:hypothetical protein
MELALIKLLVYGLVLVTSVLFIYITALAAFLYNRIETYKENNNNLNKEQ